MWSTGNLDHAYRLAGHRGEVSWAGFTRDGECALTASTDGTLRLWSTPRAAPEPDALEPGAPLAVMRQGEDAIVGARFLPGAAPQPGETGGLPGDRLLAWDVGGTVAVWGLARTDAPEATLRHGAGVVRVALAPAGDRVATVDAEGGSRLWPLGDGASGQPVELEVDATGLAFDPSGELLACVSAESEVAVFDGRTGAALARIAYEPATPGAGGARHVAFRPGHSELAIACADGRVRFFDPRKATELRPARPLFQHRFVEYSPDGSQLLVLGDTGGASVRVIDVEGPASAFGVQAQIGHKSRIMTATFDATGELVLTVSVDGTAFVFSARDGEVYSHYTLHGGPLLWGDFAPTPPGRRRGPRTSDHRVGRRDRGGVADRPLRGGGRAQAAGAVPVGVGAGDRAVSAPRVIGFRGHFPRSAPAARWRRPDDRSLRGPEKGGRPGRGARGPGTNVARARGAGATPRVWESQGLVRPAAVPSPVPRATSSGSPTRRLTETHPFGRFVSWSRREGHLGVLTRCPTMMIQLFCLLSLFGTSNAPGTGTAPVTEPGSPALAPAMVPEVDLGVARASGLDCNGNGIEDSVDIAVGRSGDLDQDGVPDECKGDGKGGGSTILGAAARTEGGPRSSSGRPAGRLAGPLAQVPVRSTPRSGQFAVRWTRSSGPRPLGLPVSVVFDPGGP